MEVTREQLRSALAKTRIIIEEPEVSNSVHGGPDGWQPLSATGAPRYPDELAEALMMVIEIEQGKPGDVVDAHICCDHEHLPDDRELALMAAILRGMRWLSPDAQQRIRNWVDERFVPRRLPTA
jgi:hypothetical protein